MTNKAVAKPRLAPVALTVTGFFALWIIYVLVLLRFPDTFDGDSPGKGITSACTRVAFWLGPLVLYAWYAEKRSFFQFLALRENWRKGLAGGAVLCGITALITALRLGFQGAEFQRIATIGLDTWLNPILSAPLVEEFMFRGLVFRALNERIGGVAAIAISSALFSLIHMPYWFLAGTYAGSDLARELGVILVIGVMLGTSMKVTGSILTPLLGHWANNIASIIVK